MVDLSLLQSVSYIVGALGVCVAAVYYVMNLRITQKNQELMLKAQQQTLETRRIGIIENIGTRLISEEGMKRFFELMNYDFTDYADYVRKYGSETNVEATAKRVAQSNSYNNLGLMLRRRLVDIEELYDLGYSGVVYFWEKYRPVIEETRRRYSGRNYCRDMEYFAGEMLKYYRSMDPSFSVPKTFYKYDSSK